MFQLDGRAALVTGASGGIGAAIARALHAQGARVALSGTRTEQLEALAAELGERAHPCPADLRDPAAADALVAAAEAAAGPLAILVNNAGLTRPVPLQDVPEPTWREIMRTNLDSAFFVGQAAARKMIPRGKGKILNVCSVQSELGRPGTAPYAASKGALKMLTKGMCADWARFGIQVNGLGPGYFETELTRPLVEDKAFSDWLCARTPAGRWGQVAELGGAAVFMCAPAADFVNGHILYVDGGMTAVV